MFGLGHFMGKMFGLSQPRQLQLAGFFLGRHYAT